MAPRGCAASLEPAELDLPARSGLRDQGGARPRPLSPALGWPYTDGQRVRHQCRREDADSHSQHLSTDPAPGSRPFDSCRVRIPPPRRLRLHRGLGCAPGPAFRRGRRQDLHRRLRRPRRPGDGHGALPFGRARLLGRRQRHHPSRPACRRPAPGPVPQPHPRNTCPSTPVGSTRSRSTSRSSSAKPSRLLTSLPRTKSPSVSSASRTTTSKSPPPSNGPSHAETSTV